MAPVKHLAPYQMHSVCLIHGDYSYLGVSFCILKDCPVAKKLGGNILHTVIMMITVIILACSHSFDPYRNTLKEATVLMMTPRLGVCV